MKKQQRRFTTEREIMAEIYSTERKMNAKLKDAEEKDDKATQYIRSGDPGLVSSGQMIRDEAARIRKSVESRDRNKLKKLKDALSAFKTELLPGMGSDTAVVL